MEFEELYERYFARVHNYIRYRVISLDAADDIVSAVFEKVLDKYGSFDPAKANIEVWLFTIARNTLNDHFRRRKVRGWLSISDREEDIPSGETPEEEARRNEDCGRVLKAMSGLADQEREIVALRFTLGMGNNDIAALTGLSESNVGVIIFRALKKLKGILGPETI